jgi:hypothetical protein
VARDAQTENSAPAAVQHPRANARPLADPRFPHVPNPRARRVLSLCTTQRCRPPFCSAVFDNPLRAGPHRSLTCKHGLHGGRISYRLHSFPLLFSTPYCPLLFFTHRGAGTALCPEMDIGSERTATLPRWRVLKATGYRRRVVPNEQYQKERPDTGAHFAHVQTQVHTPHAQIQCTFVTHTCREYTGFAHCAEYTTPVHSQTSQSERDREGTRRASIPLPPRGNGGAAYKRSRPHSFRSIRGLRDSANYALGTPEGSFWAESPRPPYRTSLLKLLTETTYRNYLPKLLTEPPY